MAEKTIVKEEVVDIFNPVVTKIAKGLQSKIICVYGTNNVGKTKVGVSLSKPIVLPFESGLNALETTMVPIRQWQDFRKYNKQLCTKKARELYDTVVFDSIDAASIMCQNYLCTTNGVRTIGEGNDGYGLWKEYETEFWEQINALTSMGYTCYFIGHASVGKEGYISPKGDKRALDPIINLCDIVCYLQSNGVDEEGRVIRSSAYLAQTAEFFARSRFDYIDTFIPEFTAANLEKAVIEAIERQEKAEGTKAVSFEEQQKAYQIDRMTYKELMDELQIYGNKMAEADQIGTLTRIVEKELGKGAKVTECVEGQEEAMSVILDNIKDKCNELGL